MKPPATLTDGVVVLRELREGDRAVVLSTMRDPLVAQWLNMPRAATDGDFDSLLRLAHNGRLTGDRFDFTVTEADVDVSVGAVIASSRHRENYEVAYLAAAAGRGRGLMTRAVRLVCDWLFERRRRPHRGAHASGQRALAASRGTLRLPARGARAEVDLAARPACRRDRLVAAAGRPAMTLHSLTLFNDPRSRFSGIVYRR